MAELHAPWVLVLPVLVALGLLWVRPPSRGVSVSVGDVPEGTTSRRTVWAARLPVLLRALAVAALAWLAASPFRTVSAPVEDGEGVAVMVVLDVSESMAEPGLGGRRKLDVALEELDRFVARREGDAVGLVTFGGEAVLRVPPSVDRGVLAGVLKRLRPGDLGDGTAIGTALGLAANRLRALEARSKVIVVLTDGRSNAGSLDPVTAARAAAGLGQKVYVLEVQDSSVEPSRLATVAAAGNGRHFAVAEETGLEEAYREIDAMEPSRLPGIPSTAQIPLASGLLWWAGGFLVAEQAVRATRWGALS